MTSSNWHKDANRDKFGRFKKSIDIESELLLSLYWGNNFSSLHIGELFKCSGDFILLKLKEFQIPSKDLKNAQSTKIKIEPEILWALYWGLEYDINRIGKICKCSYTCIQKKMRKFDIPRRIGHVSWLRDKKLPDDMKEKLINSCIGREPWNKGLKGYNSRDKNPNYRGGIKLMICPICNREYTRQRKEQKFCSNKCKYISSDNGLSTPNEKARRNKKFKKWRELVYNRDNYTCQSCGIRGGKLNAHHIKSFAGYIDLRYNLSNGITLCESCHKKLHRREM